MKKILIQNGTMVSTREGTLVDRDLLLENGVIQRIGRGLTDPQAFRVNASGLLVGPGFINLHVHFREPGEEHKEDLRSGSRAAAMGGFTSVLCMPNTQPPVDEPMMVRYLHNRASEISIVNTYFAGAITRSLQGVTMAEFGLMKEAGVPALSDDGQCVMNSLLLSRAMEYSTYFSLPLILHEEDPNLGGGGQLNRGETAFRMGIKGIPSSAEESVLARDLVLGFHSGARVHITHLTTALGVELVEFFRKQGTRVSADVTPHHLLLTDQAVEEIGNLAKVKPPLREKKDIQALKEGIKRGIIGILASDHAPHSTEDKEGDFNEAAYGISNLEISLPLYVQSLIEEGVIGWVELWKNLSQRPAQLLGLSRKGELAEGMDADVTVVDPDTEWEVRVENFQSKGRNCPFDRMPLTGWPVTTIVGGELVMHERNVLLS